MQDALAPRAARNNRNYVEANPPERSNKREKKGIEPQDKGPKQEDGLMGAVAYARGWSYGNLSRRDAARFFRAVRSLAYQCCVVIVYKCPAYRPRVK
ncbi:DNA helicase [Sarracenia purpurea var. burkii]